jgi:hypothetical protein
MADYENLPGLNESTEIEGCFEVDISASPICNWLYACPELIITSSGLAEGTGIYFILVCSTFPFCKLGRNKKFPHWKRDNRD